MTADLREDLVQLLEDPTSVKRLTRDRAIALASALAGAQAALGIRMQEGWLSERTQPLDRGLSADQAAALLGNVVDAEFLRRHWRRFPFARRLTPENLVFSERGIQAFLASGLSAVTPSSPRPISGRQRRIAP